MVSGKVLLVKNNMKHLHVLLTEDQYNTVKKFSKKHNISLALAMRFIVQWWHKDGPKVAPPQED